MNTRSGIRTLFAILALVCLGAGVVLSRAIPGLPERIPTESVAPVPDEGTEPVPATSTPDDDPAESGDDLAVEEPTTLPLFPDLEGDRLRSAVRSALESGHRPLTYRKAREAMYWIIDNRSGTVTTVYAMKPLPLEPGEWPRQQQLNCEHVWPQSKGSRRMPMKTDLFHLRPADPRTNSTRSNHPFGIPVTEDDPRTPWHVGPDADGDMVFMPPPQHRGDISRSMFYFSIRYDIDIDADQEKILRAWHREDPVDEAELKRADQIEDEQGNRNLFIDNPEVVERIDDF